MDTNENKTVPGKLVLLKTIDCIQLGFKLLPYYAYPLALCMGTRLGGRGGGNLEGLQPPLFVMTSSCKEIARCL